MTGCSAPGCKNRSEKGYKMYRFPSNPERRREWENQVGRKGWKPSQSSVLCQEHFEDKQFESGRVDGKIKLKCFAIPTIFSHNKRRPIRKTPVKLQSVCIMLEQVPTTFSLADHSYNANPDLAPSLDSSDAGGVRAGNSQSVKIQDIQMKRQESVKDIKADLRKMKRKCQAVLRSKAKQEEKMSRLFEKDQLEALARDGMRGVDWSSKTLKKALELRLACGSSGYNFLLQQNYPLPSERTLLKRLGEESFTRNPTLEIRLTRNESASNV